MNDDVLSPDKIEAALERLEAEKARRAAENPAPAVLTTERHIVEPADNAIIANERTTPPVGPRKPRRKPAPPSSEPVWFYTQVGKPVPGSPGEISESWYVISDGQVCLCNAAGGLTGERRKIEERGALWTARQMLRGRLNTPSRPDHRPLRDLYRNEGWK